MLQIYDLTVEYKTRPIGIDEMRPRFSWKLRSDEKNIKQSAYQIIISSENVVWDSGKVESDQNILIEYSGVALLPRRSYSWEVTIWDNHGTIARASSEFETGLMTGMFFEGKAKWITHDFTVEETSSPVFYRSFTIEKPVAQARLYATALGVYEAEINGQKIGEEYLAPGWTNYRKRLQYQTYVVTNIQKGSNCLQITLGNGWYKGVLGFMAIPNHYGDKIATLAMLVITYNDGSEEIIGTDKDWQVATGQIQFAELYDGETQDTTILLKEHGTASLLPYGFDTLLAQENEPVRCLQRIPVVKQFTAPNGDYLLDFGQNLSGWVEVQITGRKGQKLALRHAESLDENGNFYTGNLGFAKATDTYILNGKTQTLHPKFTFHGFRYVCVEGLSDDQDATFMACHLSSDLRRTGTFTCSDERVNRLQQNIVWGQRDNYLDVPTDCPQRSERLGWTGDATAFCPTAAFNENIMPFMYKWLHDLYSEQTPEIGMPQVVPNILGNDQAGSAFWGDAATVVPWTLYRVYGDRRILAEQFDSMKIWVEFVYSQCSENGLWQTGFQYGDWLGLDAESNALGDERKGATDDYFVANVCYAWSLQIVSEAAKILGYEEEEQLYSFRYKQLLKAFREEYITSTGRLVSETQTALVLALYFNMAPEQYRAAIAERLETNIVAHKTHLVTGFVGTPYVCLALSDNGKHELAGKLLLREDSPSWLYEVNMGATTVWERWNSILPDGSFNPVDMNSLNHYAYGSIGDWLYTRLAGLQILEPGYKRFAIKPQFIKGITWIDLQYESVYGLISIKWRCENKIIVVEITVPANTTAVLTLPEQTESIELGSGNYKYEYDTETKLEKERYSMESPLHIVLKHEAAVAILRQHAPEFLDNPMIKYIEQEPVNSMLAYSPELKEIFENVIQAMNESGN